MKTVMAFARGCGWRHEDFARAPSALLEIYYFRKIFSIAFPFASSSINLSR